MVASLDESVGNITKALKRSGLYDNSVLVFTTDNGGAPRGFNWNQGCNYPFKGGKDTFWEGGVRGVGFVHSNLIRKKGRVSYDLIDVTDWLPTFYHLAGGDVSKIQERIDGMNVWETIAHGKKSPRTEVLHNIDPIRKFAAIRVGNYKLIINQDAVYKTTWHPRYDVEGELDTLPQPSTLPGAVINCGKWSKRKETVCNTDDFPCLFNIKKDPCEYRNLAHTHIDIVDQLLHKLIDYQKKASPVWFPERDPLANPSKNGTIGFWGPWRSSTANKIILDNVLDSIPSVSGKKHSRHTNGKSNGKKMGKVFSTHEDSDKEVYLMLEKILQKTKEGKKGQIPRNSRLMKESLAMLYAKMRQKTKVDDLMHKLQMIKKGRVARRKEHTPVKLVKEQTRSSALTKMNSSLESSKLKKFMNKNQQTVDKTGTRRTEIEKVHITDDNSINNGVDNPLEMRSNSRDEDQDMDEAPPLDTSSGFEEVDQNDLENGELMADNSENDRNSYAQIEDEYDSEVESSGQSTETNDQTSGGKSEMEFQDSDGISDDMDNDNDNDNDDDNDDDNANDNGNDDFIRDNNKNSDIYL
ncbi:AP2/ERF domain-containing protein PFD0985w-like [Orbicella faveolata]|nr:AP2/ERF domain-containing protein PFD0985w-like [Orbicella faveolata]